MGKKIDKRTTREIARANKNARRNFETGNMVAVMMCGNDSAVSYLYDVERQKVVRTFHPNVEWVA